MLRTYLLLAAIACTICACERIDVKEAARRDYVSRFSRYQPYTTRAGEQLQLPGNVRIWFKGGSHDPLYGQAMGFTTAEPRTYAKEEYGYKGPMDEWSASRFSYGDYDFGDPHWIRLHILEVTDSTITYVPAQYHP